MTAFRGVEEVESSVRDSCVRCVALRTTIRNSRTVGGFMIARGPRLDYRKSHRDRWAKSCSADDPAALHRAAFSRHGNARHKDDDGGARYEGIATLRRRPIKFRRLNVDFRAVYRLTVLPSRGHARARQLKCAAEYNDEKYCRVPPSVRCAAEIRTDSSHVLEQSPRSTIITTALR